MSTRWALAKPDGDSWKGRYVHQNGWPMSAVPNLLKLHEEIGTEALLALVADHTSFSLVWDNLAEVVCHCHGENADPNVPSGDHEDTWWEVPDEDIHVEWAYVITEQGLHVHKNNMPGWEPVGFVPWSSAPDDDAKFGAIECGENYERCSHYAWYHFPDEISRDNRIGTRTYLGLDPLTVRDATHVVGPHGKLWAIRGGYQERCSPFAKRPTKSGYTHRWFSTCYDEHGTRRDFWTRSVLADGTVKPAPHTTLLYPSTKDNA